MARGKLSFPMASCNEERIEQIKILLVRLPNSEEFYIQRLRLVA
jgi:hypothetical protein